MLIDTPADISVIIPTWRRPESLVRVLDRILGCRPAPVEMLVHVDAGDGETESAVRARFSEKVRWFSSSTPRGPGGGRKLLVREARCPIVASFDDDSWPLDDDYFATAMDLFAQHSDAAVLAGREIRPGETVGGREQGVKVVACFLSGGCLLRKEAFLATRGFLPLRHAYGMEETDVALQLLDLGWTLLYAPALRVFHDTDLSHHRGPAINAAHIRNTALLAYLRYPIRYWPLGLFQVANRVRYAIGQGRLRGVAAGLLQVPGVVWRYRRERHPVRPATIALSRRFSRGGGTRGPVSLRDG